MDVWVAGQGSRLVIHELATRLPVFVTAKTLPRGVVTKDRNGMCIAWWTGEESHHWLVCFNETGELVWVPMNELTMKHNWSDGRRYNPRIAL